MWVQECFGRGLFLLMLLGYNMFFPLISWIKQPIQRGKKQKGKKKVITILWHLNHTILQQGEFLHFEFKNELMSEM